MGKKHARAQAIVAGQRAEETLREAESRRFTTERQLGLEEQYLGTPEQVAGGLGVSAAESPYLNRYQVDEQFANQLAGGRFGGGGAAYVPSALQGQFFQGANPTGLPGYLNDLSSQANALLDQAQAAAAGGNTSEAERLRLQAEGLFSGLHGDVSASINLMENPEQAARAQLGSPMARTVGGLVQQGREFLDPTSGTSQRFLTSLTEGPLRTLDVQARGTERSIRDASLGAGAARRPGVEMAVRARAGEEMAVQRAQIRAQANQFFEGFSRDFAQRTATFGQAWLQNQSGIREQFQGAADALKFELANASKFLSQSFTAHAASIGKEDEARKQRRTESAFRVAGAAMTIIGTIAGGLLPGLAGVVAGGAGGALGGTLGQPGGGMARNTEPWSGGPLSPGGLF